MTEQASHGDGPEERKIRYGGTCRMCGIELPGRTDAIYDRSTKTVRCVECPTETIEQGPGTIERQPAVADRERQREQEPETGAVTAAMAESGSGAAGSSARREYERRKAKDEERLRQKWGKLGGIAVAFSDEKQSMKAWATGAVGEERLGARLDSLISESIAVLHDRRIPMSNATSTTSRSQPPASGDRREDVQGSGLN